MYSRKRFRNFIKHHKTLYYLLCKNFMNCHESCLPIGCSQASNPWLSSFITELLPFEQTTNWHQRLTTGFLRKRWQKRSVWSSSFGGLSKCTRWQGFEHTESIHYPPRCTVCTSLLVNVLYTIHNLFVQPCCLRTKMASWVQSVPPSKTYTLGNHRGDWTNASCIRTKTIRKQPFERPSQQKSINSTSAVFWVEKERDLFSDICRMAGKAQVTLWKTCRKTQSQ